MTDDRTPVERPHWTLRCVAAFGATAGAAVLAFILFGMNWANMKLDDMLWLPLGTLAAMLAVMLALLWSGLTLTFKWSNAAFVIFVLSALMGLPFNLFALGMAFSD